MIYIKDNSQDKFNPDSGCVMNINGNAKILAGELALVLFEIHKENPFIVSAAIKTFWEEVKNDSRTN